MRRLRVVLFLIVSCSVPMSGQTNKVELFGGYSYENISPGCGFNYRCETGNGGPAANLNGLTAAVTGYPYKSLGFSAQFTGGYNGTVAISYTSVNRYTYQFGPAYVFPGRKASAFAHFLIGGVTQKSSADQKMSYSKFIWSLGGGVDLKASSRISIRPAQIDFERQSVPGGIDVASPVRVVGLRYSAGIVLHF